MPAHPSVLAELTREAAPRAEEQRLDGRPADAELASDLCVGPSLPLAEQERAPLGLGQARKRLLDADEPPVPALGRLCELGQRLRVLRDLAQPSPRTGAMARLALVLRDRQQPRLLELRHDAAPHRAKGLEERRLRRVLGVLARAERAEAVPEDEIGVPLVELRFSGWWFLLRRFPLRSLAERRTCREKVGSPVRGILENPGARICRNRRLSHQQPPTAERKEPLCPPPALRAIPLIDDDASFRELLALLLCADLSAEIVERAAEAGAASYLCKDRAVTELAGEIERLIEERRAPRRSPLRLFFERRLVLG